MCNMLTASDTRIALVRLWTYIRARSVSHASCCCGYLLRGAQVALEGLDNMLQASSREDSDGVRVLSQKCRDMCEAASAPQLLKYDSFRTIPIGHVPRVRVGELKIARIICSCVPLTQVACCM
eukprot:COSAG02_NODE_5349_length_4409_cov_1.517633_1_plen_122_part_10